MILETRTETDDLGTVTIPITGLYGINAVRAVQNFPDTTPFHLEWFKAIGQTKQACYQTYRSFKLAINKNENQLKLPFALIDDVIMDTLEKTASEMAEGNYFEHFIVPAIQGGAGTSINMNCNEIIANAALLKLNNKPGNYQQVHPIEHANIYQSTNDVIPTSLKVAILTMLPKLEKAINQVRLHTEQLEKQTANHMRNGYTQMQEAVPSSYGKLFSTYSEALSRDWWRVSKAFERIKVVNLGGGAIGTSLAIPRYFVMEVVNKLQQITNLPVARSENLSDATVNTDSFVEVHAILKAHAVNLDKMAGDIRLLASDLFKHKDIILPKKQLGSTIMPDKVNPVIAEFVISVAHKVYANDQLITHLSASGCLDLNAYLPVIGHAIIETIKLLIAANKTLSDNLFSGLLINNSNNNQSIYSSPVITTALTPVIGYTKATQMAQYMQLNQCSVYTANNHFKFITTNKLEKMLQPSALLKNGFSLNDLQQS